MNFLWKSKTVIKMRDEIQWQLPDTSNSVADTQFSISGNWHDLGSTRGWWIRYSPHWGESCAEQVQVSLTLTVSTEAKCRKKDTNTPVTPTSLSQLSRFLALNSNKEKLMKILFFLLVSLIIFDVLKL